MKYSVVALFLLILFLPFTSLADTNSPTYATYEYSDGNFWGGYTHVTANFLANGDVEIESNSDKNDEFGDDTTSIFDGTFSMTYPAALSSIEEIFSEDINRDGVEDWVTSRYQVNPAMCDGGVISQVLTFVWADRNTTVEHIVDNDSCYGTRTNKSSVDIIVQLDYVHSMLVQLVEENGIETNTLNIDASLLIYPIVLVIVFRKVMIKQ